MFSPTEEDAKRLEVLHELTGLTGSQLVRRAIFALEQHERRVGIGPRAAIHASKAARRVSP